MKMHTKNRKMKMYTKIRKMKMYTKNRKMRIYIGCAPLNRCSGLLQTPLGMSGSDTDGVKIYYRFYHAQKFSICIISVFHVILQWSAHPILLPLFGLELEMGLLNKNS